MSLYSASHSGNNYLSFLRSKHNAWDCELMNTITGRETVFAMLGSGVLLTPRYSALNLSSYFIVKSDSNSQVQCLKNVKIQVFLCLLSQLISI